MMHNISKEKHFNTWSPQSPTIMMFLPARFRIGLSAYSYAGNTYADFPFSGAMKLLEHDHDGRYCALEAEHNGTVLRLEYFKTDEWTVRGRIKAVKPGEWGLRFWVFVTMGFEGQGQAAWVNGQAEFKYRSYIFIPRMKDEPVRACLTDDYDYVGRAMVEYGYYAPLKNAAEPHWCAWAYNFEETPVIEFALAIANDAGLAQAKAGAALAAGEEALDGLKASVSRALKMEGRFDRCPEALRDVMAWNNIADFKNGRTFTSLTRYWIDRKFGGWFVWLDDVFYHALINAYSGDWQMAQNNILAALDNVTPADNLACLMSEFTEWVDRSQPPIAGFIVLSYYQLTRDKALVKRVFGSLLKAHLWWFDHRDGNGNGVLEYGSSIGGDGHFKRTKLAAKNEAAMDNSPMFDSAEFCPETGAINMEDVALNSLLALEGESLAELAAALGERETAAKLSERAETFKRRIDAALWDEERGLYANRRWDGSFVSPSPTSFYPLAAGIPDRDRAARLVKHIFDESEFWTAAPLPSIWLKDPAVNDDVYWRGRMWPPLNFVTYLGLRRYGFAAEASRLAERCTGVFHKCWTEKRACYENYNTFTGDGDSVDTDSFYGWGALIPLIWVMEHFGVNSWDGFYFGSAEGRALEMDNIKAFDGLYRLSVSDKTKLFKDGALIFEADGVGRFTRFQHDDHYAAVTAPSADRAMTVRFIGRAPLKIKVDGQDRKIGEHIAVAKGAAAKIEVWS
ncbi:MAG: hypothetical protein LBS31_05665 [Candidatus Adiutrix sp.]|jgi:putative isomerase|nr:hypothetical protein [Candidatus Adiutrix sp.]